MPSTTCPARTLAVPRVEPMVRATSLRRSSSAGLGLRGMRVGILQQGASSKEGFTTRAQRKHKGRAQAAVAEPKLELWSCQEAGDGAIAAEGEHHFEQAGRDRLAGEGHPRAIDE